MSPGIFSTHASPGVQILLENCCKHCLPYLKELPLLGGAAPQKLNRDLQKDKNQPNGDHEKLMSFSCKLYSEFNLKYFYFIYQGSRKGLTVLEALKGFLTNFALVFVLGTPAILASSG